MKFNHVPAYGFCTLKKMENRKIDPLFNPGLDHIPQKKQHFTILPGK